MFLSFAAFVPAAQAQTCTYSLSKTQQQVPAAGGSYSVQVTFPSTCVGTGTFFAKSNNSWIKLAGTPQSDGSVQYFGTNVTVNYTVQANPNPSDDQGTITIAGKTFTVFQAGAAPPPTCTYTLNPTSASFPASGGSGSVMVTFPSTCVSTGTFSAKSNNSWIKLGGPPQSDGSVQYFGTSATVNYTVDANPNPSDDQGTITIAGKTFTVFQAANAGPSTGATATVVEYYWASRDHYFISSDPAEIAALDASLPGGWVRTGETFKAYVGAITAASPVCRFYIPPIYGDSHYYTASPVECTAVVAAFPGFILEAPNVFYILLPNTTTGACPTGTIPVYRLWNKRIDTNHRYTTSVTTRNQMLAKGYVPEGYGPNAVSMCAPQ